MNGRRVSGGSAYTAALVAGLLGAFAYATYLSYWGATNVTNAFDYQSSVVAAQRDSEVLKSEQFEEHVPEAHLAFDEKVLDEDLKRIDAHAETAAERAPNFGYPATMEDYDRLYDDLKAREQAGRERFESAATSNQRSRDLSNALFALVALLFTLVQARMRRRMAATRVVVESLQRAFVGRLGDLARFDLGAVLISATAGAAIGGDIFDVYQIDERYGAFLVADFSGKGIEAAVETAFIKYSLRTLLGESRDPARALERFAAAFGQNVDRSEAFVVMFLGVVDAESNELTYASAGHEPAWFRRGNEVVQLAPTGPIAGVLADARYTTVTMRLEPGDALLVATDGLTESRDRRGALLGSPAAAQWFRETAEADAQSAADAIVRKLRRRSRRIADDLAILVLKYEGAPRAQTAT